jgi:hypothetical protein
MGLIQHQQQQRKVVVKVMSQGGPFGCQGIAVSPSAWCNHHQQQQQQQKQWQQQEGQEK